jgi:FixJ family two-component response regulator
MALSTRSGQTAVDSTERHGAGDLRRRAAEADMSAGVVFVVDDDAAIRNSLCRLITSVGSTVEVFPSARAFLEARRPDAPGCLVLDVRLPGLSGLDLQRELAATDAELPIVFLTGHGDIPMSVHAMKAGAVEFLTKPFRAQELLDAIRSAIERDRTMRAERQERTELRRRHASLTPRERGGAGTDRRRSPQQADRRRAGDERGHRQGAARPRDGEDAGRLGGRPGALGLAARHHAGRSAPRLIALQTTMRQRPWLTTAGRPPTLPRSHG